MQDRSVSGVECDRKEMIALLNSGDKRELRAFMQLYSKKIYDRALDITNDEETAKDAVRKVLQKVAALAGEGALKENIDVQLMSLTDEICSAPLFAEPLSVPAPPESAAQESAAAEPIMPEPIVPVPASPEPAEAEPAETEPVQPVTYRPKPAPAPAKSMPVPLLFEEEEERPSRRVAPLPEEEERGASPLLVIGIILLSLVVVFLVWVLVVKMMTTGMIPNYDFGFARWFDSHVFEFYY
ncbi:MAG: hypothetical protein E7330_03470 [Clostridiales bacterium]|nr:hypothetical protein [Clostridiales bacterium]